MPKVSVIVPVYKAEKYLHRCIDSILNQTISDLEVILINDCSPDKSEEIIKQYVAKDPRVFFINHEKNQGPMMARYHGYSQASGDYITFVDGDDYLPVDALKCLLDAAFTTSSDIVSGYIQKVNQKGVIPNGRLNNNLSYGSDRLSVFKDLLIGNIGHNLCGKLFKSHLFKEFTYKNFENFRNGEDAILFYSIISNIEKMTCIDVVVYYYYMNENSSSHNANNSSALDNMIRALSLQSKMIPYDKELGKLWKKYCYLALTDICRSGNKLDQIKPLLEKYDLNISLSPLSIIMHCRSKAPSCLYHLFLKK